MSTTNWTPKPGDPQPPLRYTQFGPHAYVDEDELALRREKWAVANAAPPPDPPKRNAPEAATLEALKETNESTESDEENAAPAVAYPHPPSGPAPDQYAIDWAFDQDAGDPGPKLVLVSLARHCFKPGDTLCWPSIRTICRLASMGRTAVGDNLKRLEALGLIHDTGERRGVTGRVTVWRLGNKPESGLLNSADSGPLNHPDSGPLNHPDSGSLAAQSTGIRAGMARNPDTEYPPKGGGGGGAASAAADAAAAAPLEGLDPELFALWTDGQPEHAVQKLIAHGRVLVAGGHDLNALCRQALGNRWKWWPKADVPRKPRVGKTPKRAAVAADDWSMPP